MAITPTTYKGGSAVRGSHRTRLSAQDAAATYSCGPLSPFPTEVTGGRRVVRGGGKVAAGIDTKVWPHPRSPRIGRGRRRRRSS